MSTAASSRGTLNGRRTDCYPPFGIVSEVTPTQPGTDNYNVEGSVLNADGIIVAATTLAL